MLVGADSIGVRQVKRMVAAAGNRVVGLHRHRVGGLVLHPAGLPEGRWRRLDPAELGPLVGFDPARAQGIRRYSARNATMGAVRRRYSLDAPPTGPAPRTTADPGARAGPRGGRARAAVAAFVKEYLETHGGQAPVAVLGNELGRAGIRYPGRLAPLLSEHARAAGRGAAFAVGPDLVVTLRAGPGAGTGGSRAVDAPDGPVD
jgi:hypothetical protein